MGLTFSPPALRQIDEIYKFIARDSPAAAWSVINRIYEVSAHVATNPNTGRATVVPEVRMFVVNPYPYLLYFRRKRNEVRILRVVHAARRRQFELREAGRAFSLAL
jgi:plasmid stabilization system protein ParE